MRVGFANFLVRLPFTQKWYAGPIYTYLRTESVFDPSSLVPPLPPTEINVPLRAAGLGLSLQYDSRNDNYYPSDGQYLRASWIDFSKDWGGDLEFQKGVVQYEYYHPITKPLVLAMGARAEGTSEGAPFFFLSTLKMRGFSRDRYLDNATLSVQAEARYKLSERWGVVAFTEAGWLGGSFSALPESRTILSYGAGLRWQATRDKLLNLSLDAAISSDDRAIYFRIGEAF
jgi:outer membrane protein assembly factor BamA